MTKNGISSSFLAFCWCIICFRTLGTLGYYIRVISFSVQCYFFGTGVNWIATSSRCQPLQLFISVSQCFQVLYLKRAHVKTNAKDLLTFYLQLSHIFGSDTWVRYTCAHVSIVFSFNHPRCCTTMPPGLLLHHYNATTELVGRNKRLQRARSPICIRYVAAACAALRSWADSQGWTFKDAKLPCIFATEVWQIYWQPLTEDTCLFCSHHLNCPTHFFLFYFLKNLLSTSMLQLSGSIISAFPFPQDYTQGSAWWSPPGVATIICHTCHAALDPRVILHQHILRCVWNELIICLQRLCFQNRDHV